MVVDWIVYGLLISVFATVLNHTVFKISPASRAGAWSLTIVLFFVSVAILSAAKYIRYQLLSAEVGVSIKPSIPLDIAGAMVSALLFYGLLNKTESRRAVTAHSPTSENTEVETLGVVDKSIQASTETQNAGSRYPSAKEISVHLHSLYDKGKDMEVPSMEQEAPDFFQMAWDEISNGSLQKGMWARAYSETEGNEQRAKAAYIKLRVQQLESEHTANQARQREELARKKMEERERLREEERSRPENMSKQGLLVCSVDSECKEMGIRSGDVIISHNGTDVRNNKSLFLRQLESTTASDQNKMRIVRGNQFIDLTIRGGKLGIKVAELV